MRRARITIIKHHRGLTLIELMIAMVLGLFLVAGIVSVVVANGQAHRTNAALSQVQESARTAFELLARDIREAGATGCGNGAVTNVLDPASAAGNWAAWLNTWTGLRGYTDAEVAPFVAIGTGTAQRAAGTDGLLLHGIAGTPFNVLNHDTGLGGGNSTFELSAPTNQIEAGDILLICDPARAVIFQANDYDAANDSVVLNTGGATAPGNCNKFLNPPATPACGGSEPNPPFGRNSQIMSPTATFWYVGNNGRPDEGGLSLYRSSFGGVATEIVPGITDLQIRYRADENAVDFVDAPANWEFVTAVEITLTAHSLDARVTADPGEEACRRTLDGRLERCFTTIVGIRNRVR